VASFRLLVFITPFDPATGGGRHKDKRTKASVLAAHAILKDRITRFEHFVSELGGMLSLLVSKLSVHSVKCLATFFCAKVPSSCGPCAASNEAASSGGAFIGATGSFFEIN
jgi:hypothetical protein